MKHEYVVGRVLDHFPELTAGEVVRRLRYSSFVSVARRYMYFEVPKAACTQMKELLRTVENAPPLELFADGIQETRRDMFVHARSNVPLPSLVDLDSRTQREVLESADFLRMTVVRNPYSRLLSAWKSKVALCEPQGKEVYLHVRGRLPDSHNNSSVSFEEFIEYIRSACDVRTCNPHWRRQVDHTFFPSLNFSCVAKVEQLGVGLRRLEQHLGRSASLGADGKNASIPVASAAYTTELADSVYSLYQMDFETFGYGRGTWSGGKPDPKQLPTSADSNEKFREEIVERNLIILSLYEEREQMQTQLKWVTRLGLLPLVKGLAALRSRLRKASLVANERKNKTSISQ